MSKVDGRAIDLQAIPVAFWEAAIAGVFTDLSAGDVVEMVAHEDPGPIWTLLEALLPGRYTWVYVTRGPVEWRVRLGRRPTRGATDRRAERRIAASGFH